MNLLNNNQTQMVIFSKKLWFSKTLFFNLLVGAVPVILEHIQHSNLVDNQTQAIILTVGNIVLRLMTNAKVTV